MRLIRAVRELNLEHGFGMRTIAFHTEAERRAMFVLEADDAVAVGGQSPYSNRPNSSSRWPRRAGRRAAFGRDAVFLERLVERARHLEVQILADESGQVGRAGWRVLESEGHVGQSFRNTYEQTKLEAESLVNNCAAPAVILRPSIVVGDSVTGWTPAFNVIYFPLMAFARNLLPTVPADPDGHVDIVCVDTVADALYTLLDGPVQQGTIHAVVGDDAMRNIELAPWPPPLLAASPRNSWAWARIPCPRSAPARSSRTSGHVCCLTRAGAVGLGSARRRCSSTSVR